MDRNNIAQTYGINYDALYSTTNDVPGADVKPPPTPPTPRYPDLTWPEGKIVDSRGGVHDIIDNAGRPWSGRWGGPPTSDKPPTTGTTPTPPAPATPASRGFYGDGVDPAGTGIGDAGPNGTLAKSAEFARMRTERVAKRDEQLGAIYARAANGTLDFTRMASGRPSGLDASGRPPYTNDGALNPDYAGPPVPGQVGVPNLDHTPTWAGAAQEQLDQGPNGNSATTYVNEYGDPVANPAYRAGYTGWQLGGGSTPPVASPSKTSAWDPSSQSFVFPDGTQDTERNAAGKVPTVAPSAPKPMADAIKTAQKYLDNLATARAHTTDKEAQANLDKQIKVWSKRIADYRTRP